MTSFRDSYRDLLRFLTHRTGNVDDAHDLAQDTWLRLAEHSPRKAALPQGDEARAYVFTVARNLAIDHLRKHRMVQRHAAAASLPAPHGPDEAEGLMYRQAIRLIELALADLPERARQVFLRNKVHGDDQQALAAAFGVSRNTIERDMMLAMSRVEAALAQWHAGLPESWVSTSSRVVSPSGRRRSFAALLGVAGLSLGSAALWRWWATSVAQSEMVLSTVNAQKLRQQLPDESMVTLDAASHASVSYFGSHRHVSMLAGAGFFEVARDADRPFMVDTLRSGGGSVRVTVLGTRFGVDLGGSEIQVQVDSGHVRVDITDGSGRATTHVLGAREALSIPAGGAVENLQIQRFAEIATWRDGRLVFDRSTLRQVVDRLRRYLPRPIALDASVAGLRLSGQVRISQAQDFLQSLPASVPVRSALSADGKHWEITAR